MDMLKSNKTALEQSIYKETAFSMHKRIQSMILDKQKSAVAIALSIANSGSLIQNIENRTILKENYDALIKNFKDNTLYKNIWIHILDRNAISLYRSWSDKKGDNILKIRRDILEVILSKKVVHSISIGMYNMSMKAIVPVMKGSELVGIIEVISHFNSIAKNLKKFKIDSVVVSEKEYKSQLKYPFTGLFIDDYYVANFNAKPSLMKYLKDNSIRNYFNDSFKIENGFVISSHTLLDIRNKPIGYFIMFKKTDDISNVDLDFFTFKWFMIGVILFMSIVIFISVILFYIYIRDKKYYEKIIDTSNNIIIINDTEEGIREVNRTFFRYFDMYITLKEFKLNHSGICDFFTEDSGYLKKENNGVRWIEYMVQHTNDNHKIKMKIGADYYYFSASASVVNDKNNLYAIIMSDITKQEKYKNELERLSITDTLTDIGNRRFFQQKIDEELARAKRYGEALSLIICDVDYFKNVNDKYGHNVGDEVLIEYTKLISSNLRINDVFCRVGGEEFIMILPHTKKDAAYKLAEKIRHDIEVSKKVVSITMSFGVVEYINAEDSEAIFKRADKALYMAKNSGRNIVVVL